MEERINQALTQLENDLNDLRSAREQVDNVITTYTQLQKKVENFSSAVVKIYQHFEEDTNNVKYEFIKRTQEVEKSIIKEAKTLHSELDKLIKVEHSLSTSINTIQKSNNTIDSLANKLNLFQSTQDNEFQNIKTSFASLSNQGISIFNTITDIKDNTSTMYTQIQDKQESISKDIKKSKFIVIVLGTFFLIITIVLFLLK